MMLRKAILALAVALIGATACTDRDPAGPATSNDRPLFKHDKQRSGLLSEIPVTGSLPGGTFDGVLTINALRLQGDQVVASGVLTGTADLGGTVTAVTQNFTDIPLDLSRETHSQCAILNLDLGPLHLDLLGLVVDLSIVQLDITAESGPGNLLGNLLCAVAGLLDGVGTVPAIGSLLEQVTGLLG